MPVHNKCNLARFWSVHTVKQKQLSSTEWETRTKQVTLKELISITSIISYIHTYILLNGIKINHQGDDMTVNPRSSRSVSCNNCAPSFKVACSSGAVTIEAWDVIWWRNYWYQLFQKSFMKCVVVVVDWLWALTVCVCDSRQQIEKWKFKNLYRCLHRYYYWKI